MNNHVSNMNQNGRYLFQTCASIREASLMTGKCLCGQVSWSSRDEPTSVHHCHCRMCRRWSGGAFATLVWFKTEAVRWTGALPKSYRSSPIAQRSHCETCGSPIHLAYNDGDEIAIAAGTVDHPEALRPTHHYGIESRLAWADIALDHPGQSTREQW
jgi:hypothetical protein